MQARLLCDTGGACPCAGVRTAARARFARACACMRLRRSSDRNAHGVCAYAEGFTYGYTILPFLRGDRGMRSASAREAAQAAAAPARMRCAPPRCGGARLRATAVAAQWLFCWCGCGAAAQWCLYPRPSACAAAPRVRWRVPPACVFVRHLLAVFAVSSAHSFHHLRKRLMLALAGISLCILLLARTLS
jgi:hypothetical protein